MELKLALIAPMMEIDVNSYKTLDRKVLPLGIYTLKSYLLDDYPNTIVIDAITHQYSEDDIVDIIRREGCNIVGVSGMANRYYNSITSLVNRLKKDLEIPFVFVGGAIATFCYDVLLGETKVDFVIRGEGELVIKNILDRLSRNEQINDLRGICYIDHNGKVCVNPCEQRLKSFDLFREEKYNFSKRIVAEFISGARSYVIMGSRGCKGNCTFCQVPDYYGARGVWWREPIDVVNEIDYAVNHWGVRRFNFQDSNFLLNTDWLIQFIDEIKKREIDFKFNIFADAECINRNVLDMLKQIGLYQVFVGFETGSEHRFSMLDKKAVFADNQQAVDILKSMDFKVLPGFILFFPDSTIDEIVESVEWFNRNGLIKPSMYFNKMDLWYGTKMYKTLENAQCITRLSINDGIGYRFIDPAVDTLYEFMTIGLEFFKDIWRSVTLEDAKRRKMMIDIVYEMISESSFTQSYHLLACKIDDIFNGVGENSYGRSLSNQNKLNNLVRDFFFMSVKLAKEYYSERGNGSKIIRKFASESLNNFAAFEYATTIGEEEFRECLKASLCDSPLRVAD